MEGRAKVSVEKIAKGADLVESKQVKDKQDVTEEQVLRSRREIAEIDALEQRNSDRIALRKLRFDYAKLVFYYLCAYTLGSAGFLFSCGLKLGGFSLPDVVLTTVVGSTAAAAIGLVGFVVSGLFRNVE
jgi:hypothetical protein